MPVGAPSGGRKAGRRLQRTGGPAWATGPRHRAGQPARRAAASSSANARRTSRRPPGPATSRQSGLAVPAAPLNEPRAFSPVDAGSVLKSQFADSAQVFELLTTRARPSTCRDTLVLSAQQADGRLRRRRPAMLASSRCQAASPTTTCGFLPMGPSGPETQVAACGGS